MDKNNTFKKSSFFIYGNNGVTELWLSNNFESFLKLAPEELDIVSLPLYQITSRSLNDFDIRKVYGEAIIKNPQEILQEMHAVITSNSKTLADGNSINWYYLEPEEGGLCHASCFFVRGHFKWQCQIVGGDREKHSAGFQIAVSLPGAEYDSSYQRAQQRILDLSSSIYRGEIYS